MIPSVQFEKLFEIPLRNGLTKPKRVRGEGVKFVNMGEIFRFDRLVDSPMERAPLSDKERASSLLMEGDLLFARQSLVAEGAGKVSIFLGDAEECTFESHIIRARLNKEITEPNYYYYFFKSYKGRTRIRSIVEQVAAAGIRGSDLAKLHVPLPSLSEQKAIASVLGALDDKIENNRRMNETLEDMARTLFKSWFVSFDPVHAKAALENHSPLEGESANQGQSPQMSRWGGIERRYTAKAQQHAQTLRKNQTDAEGLLWHYLRKKQLAECKFRRQQPIGNYIVDFACMSKKLVIELDGSQHAEQKSYDANRDKFLQDSGYRVLRYWNNQVLNDGYTVLEDIYNHLFPPPHQSSPDGSTSATPPQGGSEWTVERARRYLAHMDFDTAALFPSTFGEDGLPEGWEAKPLDSIADFFNGAALQKFSANGGESLPVIKIAELRNGLSANTHQASVFVPEKYVVSDGDVLFAWSGSLMQKVWTEGKGALNQHLFKVTSENYEKWFFYYWVHHHMKWFQSIAASKATTMGHIQRMHLTEAQVVVPNNKVMQQASKLIGSLLEKQIQNSLENKTLAELRDTLLPKLMSGEVRVKDAEYKVEHVL